MNHNEATEQMLAERYLLNELTPDLREAFEEHAFECQDCALDLRAGSFFVQEAKAQLPGLVPQDRAANAREKKKGWFAWWSPAFAVPTFAVLLAIIGYQNLAVIPGLRSATAQPEIQPWASVHMGTRGSAAPLLADRQKGIELLVDVPQQANYASYEFALHDAQNKLVWKMTAPSSAIGESGTASLSIRPNGLQPGAYSLTVSALISTGQVAETETRALEIRFAE